MTQRFVGTSILVISLAAATAGCGDDAVSSASATDSGTDSSTSDTTDTTTTTTGASQSASATVTQGSESMTGDSSGTTDDTTTSATATTTTTTTGETTTTGVDPTTGTTTDDTTTTGVDPTTTTTGDTTTTTGGDTTTTGGDTTTGGEVLPGSCRMSEYYGSAGARPAFTDPAYANFLDKQVAVVTTSTQAGSQSVLHVVDISGPPPPPNSNYAAPRYTHPSWSQASLGRIFGVTLDSSGNIYVAATTVFGATASPNFIKKIDGVTGEITTFATVPNNGPALGNLNYDCVSESIYASNHEDGRIYQFNLKGQLVSTYRHSDKDVTLGPANDAGEPNGQFAPLGQRVWAVQSHAGRLYYSVWWEHVNVSNPNQNNEVWSVAYQDEGGVPDGATAKLEFKLPDGLLTPVSDISFTQPGRMVVARRSMYQDNATTGHQSNVLTYEHQNGVWAPLGEVYKVGELNNSAAGGVDHDFAGGGYVWFTGDALDFYTQQVVYGIQGTPLAGGTITNSTLIDMDGNLTAQAKTAQGDVEVPIPDDAAPVTPPK